MCERLRRLVVLTAPLSLWPARLSTDAGQTTTVNFALELSPVHEEVTVIATPAGRTTIFEAFNAVTTLDAFELSTNAAGPLGEVLENELGVAKRSFGPGASRPIIRGFDGDRVLMMEDGIGTGDLASQSGDHGVTIDISPRARSRTRRRASLAVEPVSASTASVSS